MGAIDADQLSLDNAQDQVDKFPNHACACGVS